MEDWRPEFAEALPFSRAQIAGAIGVSPRLVNNWIDRNELWPEDVKSGYRGYYRLADVFDLAGFSAMRIAHIPERQCAQHVRNFGFYRSFLHGDQIANFSFRNGAWDIGLYDPSAIATLRINMRTVGKDIFRRISELISSQPGAWPKDSFASFRNLYLKAIELERLTNGIAPLFEDTSQ